MIGLNVLHATDPWDWPEDTPGLRLKARTYTVKPSTQQAPRVGWITRTTLALSKTKPGMEEQVTLWPSRAKVLVHR